MFKLIKYGNIFYTKIVSLPFIHNGSIFCTGNCYCISLALIDKEESVNEIRLKSESEHRPWSDLETKQ